MFVLIYFVCSLLSIYADLTQYDQRQTGDVNVQVDLKDLQFFAVLKGDKEEYVDYDYAYDYSELTIKPQNRTTPKPYNGTSASTEKIGSGDKTTAFTTVLQERANVTNSNYESTTSAFTVQDTSKDDTTTVKSFPDVTTERNKPTTVQNVRVTADSAPINQSTNKPCRKGYVLNKKGQCQLKMNTAENALLRLVKLSQKLKSRRENKSNDNP